jgi:hypothetical protein
MAPNSVPDRLRLRAWTAFITPLALRVSGVLILGILYIALNRVFLAAFLLAGLWLNVEEWASDSCRSVPRRLTAWILSSRRLVTPPAAFRKSNT